MAIVRLESHEYKKYKYGDVDEMMSHIAQLQSQNFVLMSVSVSTLTARFMRPIA